MNASNIAYMHADFAGYPAKVEKLRNLYLNYPRVVSIETQVKCNAKCHFCPYPSSPRQGEEMPEELFLKIIDDLSVIPVSHSFNITLARINEPLLDPRLQYFHQVIADKLPSAIHGFWTNGTMLKNDILEWMSQYKNGSLSVSLNSVNEEEHVKMMGFGLKKVCQGLDNLHMMVESGQFTLTVILAAPFQSEAQAENFESVCRSRWPLFRPGVRPFFEWMGDSHIGSSERNASIASFQSVKNVKSFSCGQWFDLHILANGYATKCCIDETGFVGDERYDTRNRNVLDIYKEGHELRQNLLSRSTVEGCNGCMHLG